MFSKPNAINNGWGFEYFRGANDKDIWRSFPSAPPQAERDIKMEDKGYLPKFK